MTKELVISIEAKRGGDSGSPPSSLGGVKETRVTQPTKELVISTEATASSSRSGETRVTQPTKELVISTEATASSSRSGETRVTQPTKELVISTNLLLTLLLTLTPHTIQSQQALQSKPNDPELTAALAHRRQDEGNLQEAERLLTQALVPYPDSLPLHLALGNLYAAQQQYPNALIQYQAVLADDPHNPAAQSAEVEAATRLALQLRANGDQQRALDLLEHTSTLVPNNPDLLTDIGIQAQSMHHLKQASAALTESLQLRPNDLRTTYALARVELDQDNLPAAEQHLRLYLHARPRDATAHFGLASLLRRQLRNPEAEEEFQRSIALQPLQTESYYQLGQIALDDHRDDKARSYFEKALTRDPAHGGALTGMGILAYRNRNYIQAVDSLSNAAARSPEYQPAHYYLGLALARLGRTAQSQSELARALDLMREQQGKDKPLSIQ